MITPNLKNKVSRLSNFFETDMTYVIRNGFWMNANFVLTSLFGLATSLLFAHLASKETYGTYQFVLALAGTIAVFVPNNMSSAVFRSVAQGNEGDLVAATKFQIKWGLVGTIISLGVSGWYLINNNPELSLSFIVVALFMPVTYAFNTWSAYVQGKKDYKRYFFYNTIGTTISYGGVIAVLLVSHEFFWLITANIIFAFFANILLYRMTIKRMAPNHQTSPDTIPYGVNLSLMGIPQGITGQLDALLIFHFLGAVPLAAYSFATIFPERLAGGLKFISAIIMPKFSEKSEAEVRSFFYKKVWWLLGFLAIVAGSYALIAPSLFALFFPKYAEAIPYTQVYGLSFFIIAASVANTALVSQKKTKYLYVSSISIPLLKTVLLVALLASFGIWGVIWAQIITILFQIILPIHLLFRDQRTVSTQ